MEQNQKQEQDFDVVGFILDFEGGTLSQEDTIEGFQHLIDTGMAWQLQGFYGRTAERLIDAGYCTPKKELH